ncbi:MAG: tRNA (N(6)-L-threonylcarbamoyladenosine(37)-C(2))-methylthiotransferase MtaB, partial [Sphaerochaetaceae bacterium]|nr:tRNA (N(6)-L-threonylcarbamoyladenosine(37)-C(2))-methylthiotransferase MtaB [Sphaerochaetaceae bacterium]
MQVFVYTLGCRVNQCESEAIAEAFSKEGHTVSKDEKGCDLIIVNTCTVTSKAEQKARRVIRLFAKEAPVLVTGCYAQLNSQEIEALGSNIFVVSLEKKPKLLQLPVFIKEHNNFS